MTTSIIRTPETLGVGGHMVVRHDGGPPKVRKVYRYLPSLVSGWYAVHNNNLANLVRGLRERVFCVEVDGALQPTLRPARGVFAERMEQFRRRFMDYVFVAAPLSLEGFLECYRGDRRYKTYEMAVESLKASPVQKRDAHLATFVKAEKIGVGMPGGKPDPAPRVIQPRTPRYNVEVGRFLKKLEHRIYDIIADIFGGPTVMKGYNGKQTASHLRQMWDQFRRPVAVGLDASRFDQHVSPAALVWEHGIYTAFYRGADAGRLRELLSWQRHNIGRARVPEGLVKYEVSGCRMSGDMNTALGNCLLMSGMVWSLAQRQGVPVRLANNGDDCIVFMEAHDLHRFMRGLPEWFRDMGFTMKVEEPVYEFEEIEFCQSHPVFTGDGWRMVRNPHVVVAKDLHTVLPLDQERIRLGYLTTLGECGLALNSGVPIMQELYLAMIRSGRGVHIGLHPGLESGARILARNMDSKSRPVSIEARVSFWKAFGIMPCDQVAAEEACKAFDFGRDGLAVRETCADPTAVPELPTCISRAPAP